MAGGALFAAISYGRRNAVIAADHQESAGNPTPSKRVVTVWLRLRVWFYAGVAAGVLPLLAVALQRLRADKPCGVIEVLATGELIIISLVLLIGVVGDFALASYSTDSSDGIFNIIGTMITLTAGGILYGFVKTYGEEPSTPHPGWIAFFSIAAFGVCLISGARSISLMSRLVARGDGI